MKLDEGDGIVGVQICTAEDDVLLTSRKGQCIRFAVTDVRVFKGRDSTGVYGIRFEDGDEVISMAILRHVDATPAERAAYLRQASALRRASGEENGNGAEDSAAATTAEADDEAGDERVELSYDRYVALGAAEQF